MKRKMMAIAGIGVAASLVLSGCAAGSEDSGGDVTIDFSQWWEVELKEGVMREMMDNFRRHSPIKHNSAGSGSLLNRSWSFRPVYARAFRKSSDYHFVDKNPRIAARTEVP